MSRPNPPEDPQGPPLSSDGSDRSAGQPGVDSWLSLGPLAPGPEDAEWLGGSLGSEDDGGGTQDSISAAISSSPRPQQDRISHWNRYRSLELVSRGGMGLVYKAWDPRLKRTVALKFLAGNHPQQVLRFLHEAQSQARVHHENVCQIYEVDLARDQPFISMQYLEGPSLDKAAPELRLEEKLDAIIQAAEGVHAAHLIGLIHRDLKPANIVVERPDGAGLRAYVLDFGLVKDLSEPGITVEGHTLGTPGYMAPEQLRGDRPADIRTDVYGLGASLYRIVCGRPIHSGGTITEVMLKGLQEDPVAPSKIIALPRDLESIILRCLETDPERRYQTARGLADDLRRFLRGEAVSAVKPSIAYKAKKWYRRNQRLSWLGGASLAALLAVGTWGTLATVRSSARARLAGRFSAQAQILEDRIRLEYAMPLHDLGDSRREAGRTMVALGLDMARQGGPAQGPGHLALGKAHLLLGNPAMARKHGEAALRSGFKEVEVAALLGTSLAIEYQKELQGLSGAARRERAAELETELRSPSERFLERTRGQGHEDGDYLEARLDLVAGRLEAARAKARHSRVMRPWHVESWELEAQGWVEEASRSDLKDRGAQGEEAFRRAGEVLAEGLVCNRSALPLLLAEADRRLALLKFRRDTGRFEERDIAWAEAGALAVLGTDRPGAEARLILCELHYLRAHRAQTLQQDPGPSLQHARTWVQEVLQADPDDHRALVQVSAIEFLSAQWALLHGADPRPWVRMGLGAGNRAAGIRTGPALERNLGDLHYLHGLWQVQHGEAPDAALASAKRHHSRAIELRPSPRSHGALGKDYVLEVQALLAQARPVKPALDQALLHYRVFWDGLPDALSTVQSRSEILVQVVEFLLQEGQDPAAHLEEARRAAETFAQRKEGAFWGRIDLGITYQLQAKWNTRSGKSPVEALLKARALLDAARALEPSWPDFALLYANLEVEHLRWLRKLGQEPGTHREQLLRWTRMALETHPKDYGALLTRAEGLGLCRPEADRRAARQALEQAVAISPLHQPAARKLAGELGLEERRP